ncbi:MAG: LruC domain-containing protein [Duncaniella sp.]|nr:LruC domain-containing protein [Duncaniella sp.]
MKLINGAAAVTLSFAFLTACTADKVGQEIPAHELYVRQFIKNFGVPNPNQDWSFASSVTAELLPSIPSKAHTIKVYTSRPGTEGAALAAKFSPSTRNFTFDFPREAKSAYVEISSASGVNLFAADCAISEGRLLIGEASSRVADEDPAVGLVNILGHPSFTSINVGSYNLAALQAAGFNPEEQNVECVIFDDFDNPHQLDWANQIQLTRYQLSQARDGFQIEVLGEPTDYGWHVITLRLMREVQDGVNTGWECHLQDYNTNEGEEVTLDNGVQSRRYIFDSDNFGDALKQFDMSYTELKNFGAVFMGQNIKIYRVRLIFPNAYNLPISEVFKGGLYGMTQAGQGFSVKENPSAADRQSLFTPGNFYKPPFDTNLGKVAPLRPILGNNGMFADGVHPNGSGYICNLEKYRSQLKPDTDIIFDVDEDDMEVNLNYFYGCTVHYNSIGYFYWEGDRRPSDAELLARPKYLFAFDATPGHNLQTDNNGDGNFASFMSIDNANPANGEYDSEKDRLFETLLNKVNDEDDFSQIKGSTYKLLYYGADGKSAPSYKFPKGTHIAFFNITGGYYRLSKCDEGASGVRLPIGANSIAFSMPSLNKLIGNVRYSGHGHASDRYDGYTFGDGEVVGSPAFASYKWNGSLLLAVEDCPIMSDDDMNDMLFAINGVTNPTVEEVKDPHPVSMQSWILAAEDLGTTDDLDYNDVVVGISHVATDNPDEKYVYFTGLASGGTLPVQLQLQGKPIGGEFHMWFDRPDHEMVNTYDYSAGHGQTWRVKYTGDFHLSDFHEKGDNGLRDFTLLVDRRQGNGYENLFPTDADYSEFAPKFVIFKSSWKHPYERTHLLQAYPAFEDWIKLDPASANTPEGQAAYQKVVDSMEKPEGRVIDHKWTPDPETLKAKAMDTGFSIDFGSN